MKVYISICSSRDWKPQFGSSLCGLVNQCAKSKQLEGYFIKISQQASLLPKARRIAVEEAIAGGFTHILMIDDDSRFPGTMLETMIERNVDFLGVNYVSKDPKVIRPVSYDMDGRPLFSTGKTGAQEVSQIGFGTVLINLDVFKKVPKPWFEVRWLEARNDEVGEDIYFCLKARNHGVSLYVDHDVSNKCGHIGDYSYEEARCPRTLQIMGS